jgi:hypothetical protein
MEVTARPGFHLFKTDPGYNDRALPATRAVVNRLRRALSSRPLIRLRIAASSNADVLEPDRDRVDIRDHIYP